ncbi:MAG: hypothetical protein IT269_07565 [Saprospiraceae bacterium]|nr:hypothetical protein [Saprospiraceae bacterium]
MNTFLPTLLRTVLTFAAFCVLQYIIPYYLLAAAGIVAGVFMLKTGEDRALSLGILVGSILFVIFAYAMAQIYPISS